MSSEPQLLRGAGDRQLRSRRSLACASSAALALALGCLAGCNNNGSLGEAFVIQNSEFVGPNDGTARVRGDLAVFRADEALHAGGTDLNGDGDGVPADLVAVAIRFSDHNQRNIGAAAREMAILGSNIFLVVDEAGNNDWNMNAVDELVLLRWNFSLAVPVFVDLVDPDSPIGLVVAGERLWYAADLDPLGVDQTNLRYIDTDDATMIKSVDSDGATLGAVRVQLVGADEGLLRLAIDEAAAGGQGSQNGDIDELDAAVLALVEVGASPPLAVGSGLAQPNAAAPFDVREVSPGFFKVACLVSESGQNNSNLNGGASGLPASCVNGLDLDTTDNVVHVIEWQSGTIATTTNTQLAGASRLILMEDFVVALTAEEDLGDAGGCDLTGDGFTDDFVVRWSPLADLANPVDLASLYLPIATTLPGGALGLGALEPRLLAAIETSFDVNGSSTALPWLGSVGPGSATQWNFIHSDPDDPAGLRLGLRRMQPELQTDRLRIELLESSVGQNLNLGCNAVLKDGQSADQDDAIPAWLRFQESSSSTVVSGMGFATDPLGGGVVLAFGRAFFRVSELDDGVDWNQDGDKNDRLLIRSPLTTCFPVVMATSDTGPASVIVSDGLTGALLFTDEAAANQDLNGDGVVSGLAVRYFRDF